MTRRFDQQIPMVLTLLLAMLAIECGGESADDSTVEVVGSALLGDFDFDFEFCKTNAQCNDGNPCTVDQCVRRRCVHTNRADGTVCNDRNACTTDDTCQAGQCAGSAPVVCLPPNQCQSPGVCNPRNGRCVYHAKAGSACDDGNTCTHDDRCTASAAGVCRGRVRRNGSACDDGRACTQNDMCRAGTCVGNGLLMCTQDTTAPQLLALAVSPLTVDTTAGPATVTIRIEALDDLSGFGGEGTGNGSIDVRHSSGTNPVGAGSLPITGGTPLRPTFDLTLTFPQFSQAGTYPISLDLVDNVFNSVHLTSADLAARGLPSSVEVISTSDVTAPQLLGFAVSQTSVDTTAGPATITVHIEATDDISGFGSGSTGNGSIDVRHSSGTNPVGLGSLPITGGTSLHPTFDLTLTFPQVGSSRVDLQACKLEYSIVSPK